MKKRATVESRRGTALLFSLILVVAMAGLSLALLTVNLGTKRSRVQTLETQRGFYAAEAGLSDAFYQLTEELIEPPAEFSWWIGSPENPVPLGSSAYFVEIAPLGPRAFSLTSTGIDDENRERLELVVSKAASGFFQYAAFGAEGVQLDSNSFIDSYDSAFGTYDSQVQGGNEYALENGNVGSNKDIHLMSNTQVHGDVRPGPGHVLDATAPGIYISGSTDPLEEAFELPEIPVPPVPSSEGSLVGSTAVVLGPGEVRYDSVTMMGGSSLTIRGPAVVVIDDFLMKSNTDLVFDTLNGPIELYGTGDFVLASNSRVTTYSDSALDVTLLLSGNNMTASPADRVELGANSEFIGAIYAPNAEFKLASNFNIYGSIMCGRLHLSSYGEIHFDEALLYDGWGATEELESVYWHRLPKE